MLWLCVDPGETTGWSIWRGKELVEAGQLDLWPFIDGVDVWLQTGLVPPDELFHLPQDADQRLGAIVCEDWKIYPWLAEVGKLNFDACRTARGIGALELLCRQHGVKMILQGADIKEGAKAAGAEELYLAPVHENRHANDSIQHGVFYTARHGKAPA
jgi:hypothetical protein